MFIMIAIFIMSVVGFLVHLAMDKKSRTKFRVIELALLYQLFFNMGLASLLSFFGLILLPELVADYLGWPTCPFQHELANVNLGYATLGVMAIWFRGHFWTAIVIGSSIWLLGDAIGHIYHILEYNNLTEGNTGVPLYSDIFVPAALIILLVYYLKWFPKRQAGVLSKARVGK